MTENKCSHITALLKVGPQDVCLLTFNGKFLKKKIHQSIEILH